MLSKTALEATKLAEEAACKEAWNTAHVFLKSDAAESEPSGTVLERVDACTGATRTRPTRTTGASSSRSETERALYSLLR